MQSTFIAQKFWIHTQNKRFVMKTFHWEIAAFTDMINSFPMQKK